jgi:hypothetical protein
MLVCGHGASGGSEALQGVGGEFFGWGTGGGDEWFVVGIVGRGNCGGDGGGVGVCGVFQL